MVSGSSSNESLVFSEDEVGKQSQQTEDTYDHLRLLLKLEEELYPLAKDYLHSLNSSDGQDKVNELWRRKLCEWVYEVVDHFHFDREVVSIALNYLDRSVSILSQQNETPIQKKEFQLFTVTALYMAIKIHGESDHYGNSRLKLKIESFVELSRGCFPVEVIEQTEAKILSLLNWHVNPPTMLKFIHTLLQLCPTWTVFEHRIPHPKVINSIYDLARYLTELSVCIPDFAFKHKASTIAYCAILCAIEGRNAEFPLPYEARVALVNNMSHATQLFPATEEIRAICSRLKAFQPELFEHQQPVIIEDGLHQSMRSQGDLAALAEDGKVSPVSVVDTNAGSPGATSPNGSRRKRVRAEA